MRQKHGYQELCHKCLVFLLCLLFFHTGQTSLDADHQRQQLQPSAADWESALHEGIPWKGQHQVMARCFHTDSLACIHILKDPCLADNEQLQIPILARAASITGREDEVILHWLPWHVGNERADTATRTACTSPIVSFLLRPNLSSVMRDMTRTTSISRYSLEKHESHVLQGSLSATWYARCNLLHATGYPHPPRGTRLHLGAYSPFVAGVPLLH